MNSVPTGCIETMLISNGKITLLDYHQGRLHNSVKAISKDINIHSDILQDEVAIYLEEGHNLVLRAEWNARFPDLLLMTTRNIPVPVINYSVMMINMDRPINTEYSWIKSRDRQYYDTCMTAAKNNGKNDAILVNTDGNVVETCIGNIIYSIDDNYYTPPLEDGCVAGVQRAYLLEHGINGKPLIERSLNATSINDVNELLLCNAVRGILPIAISQ